MSDTITSVTMTRELVESILADYLNRTIFRTPVSVTGSEVLDESVILTLTDAELVTTSNPITWTYPERSESIYTTTTVPAVGQLNGNGNGNGHTVGAGSPRPASPEETTAPQPQASPGGDAPEATKRRAVTPEEDAEILRLHADGWSEPQIAAELGLGKSTVHYRLALTRKPDGAA